MSHLNSNIIEKNSTIIITVCFTFSLIIMCLLWIILEMRFETKQPLPEKTGQLNANQIINIFEEILPLASLLHPLKLKFWETILDWHPYLTVLSCITKNKNHVRSEQFTYLLLRILNLCLVNAVLTSVLLENGNVCSGFHDQYDCIAPVDFFLNNL